MYQPVVQDLCERIHSLREEGADCLHLTQDEIRLLKHWIQLDPYYMDVPAWANEESEDD